MECPICEGKTKVMDSRQKGLLHRRRKCLECGERYSTYEIDPVTFLHGLAEGGVQEEQLDRVSKIIELMADKNRDINEIWQLKEWTLEEDYIIESEYPEGGSRVCKLKMPYRSTSSINNRASRLKVKYIGGKVS